MSTDLEEFVDELDALREMGPEAFSTLSESLDPDWISAALSATGTASARRRKFPAEQALWLVLGMGLFADRSITNVIEHLSLVLPGVDTLSPSAVSAARYRLGDEPLEHLFHQLADDWATPKPDELYKGLRLLAIDGTSTRVQDSDKNYEEYGKPAGRGGTEDAGYPQVRIVCLQDVRTRLMLDLSFDKFNTAELTLAKELWSRIPQKSLTLMDRYFNSYAMFYELYNSEERHMLVRMRKSMKVSVIEVLPDGSQLVELKPHRTVTSANPSLKDTCIRARVIAYKHPGGEPGRLFTTLVDCVKHPAQELIELYHERWEIEIGFDEIKTHMLERKECLRSKCPVGVRQELWGLFTVYNLVRYEMLNAARHHKLNANRVSFRSSLLWLRNFWEVTAWIVSPGTIPKHLKNLRSTLDVLFLPPRRKNRRYPRHVKIKMSTFPRNRGKRPMPVRKSTKPLKQKENQLK